MIQQIQTIKKSDGNMRLAKDMRELGIVDQVKKSIRKSNRIAMIAGCVLGGFVPVATYTLAHCEVNPELPLHQQLPALMVVGGLIYSAMTVFQWGKIAFKHPAKSFGFVVLLEGTMTFSHAGVFGIPLLSLVALMMLVAVNAVAAATMLVLDQKSKK